MRSIQKVVIKVIDAFLAVVGLVFFLIYVVLIGLTILVVFPIFMAVDFKEFVEDPLGFIKAMLAELKEL
ncbi:hypothetical protein [Campylobacter concisus]|uniref:hypothetical protein n=1 Tax=Campylobacter concisus TaxID=199 RepID=UPI000CD997E9|nr:hypothetical protein [Campylobacter concisus]